MPTTTHPPAWRAAVARYEAGYGERFDAADGLAVAAVLALLEEAVRARIEDELTAALERFSETAAASGEGG